ncbi:uncharacterized acetyltransferase At3g50280-like [Dioscorea cayenensis subsp. rotundata]|uniref:Uncharacterized acetyltransferase At3g50280-like n=1 Tax=Dioscorea cayennensis subsp. rotundata TaxID=55577 RepID=A0AB40B179_DIOCR|nr:uncharacterized acetyltransferase At3g50280-like [Dioscorea cayenensis subsp. rotundata]
MATEDNFIHILSKNTVHPSPTSSQEDKHGLNSNIIHLTPWDLRMLSVHYIQKGLLFTKPQPYNPHQTISHLLSSFSLTLNHFFPLAGRLKTIKHNTSSPSLTIFLDCNNHGADFIHASAPQVKIADIVEPLYTPTFVYSLFPLNGVLNYDGHTSPLLAVQVTELADGLFIGASLNHSVADGTSFWHFINSWSDICRNYNKNGENHILVPPVLDRWFLDSHPLPIRLPFGDSVEFIRRTELPLMNECFVQFSRKSLAELKAKANSEMGSDKISTLQALMAHVWRSVTRARRLEAERETTYVVLVGNRNRVSPPIPEAYLGNTVFWISAQAQAGDIIERGLGWVASLLNKAVASQSEAKVHQMLTEWTIEPSFVYTDEFKPTRLATGSSPRFNVYGNDFGWGPPITVRSGLGNKIDGKVTVYPSPEVGGMALEICLSSLVLGSLLKDEEFVEVVNQSFG